MKAKIKIPKKYRLKLIFLGRLFVLGIIFNIVWHLSPSLGFLRFLTAFIVALTTGGSVIKDMGQYYVSKGGFNLLIISDCTGWKEIFVFLSLLISWPKEKSWRRAVIAILLILLFNIVRLDLLVIFSKNFDYFHPFFQVFSIFVILYLWYWCINVKRKRVKKRKLRKKRP